MRVEWIKKVEVGEKSNKLISEANKALIHERTSKDLILFCFFHLHLEFVFLGFEVCAAFNLHIFFLQKFSDFLLLHSENVYEEQEKKTLLFFFSFLNWVNEQRYLKV